MARSKRPAPTTGQEAYRILRASQARLAATEAATATKTFLRTGPAGPSFEAIDVQSGLMDRLLSHVADRAPPARRRGEARLVEQATQQRRVIGVPASRRHGKTEAAIDDATRVRALKVYDKHTQANAIDFVDHIIEKFPFRIKEIRTDNGHEFQAKFHWHVEDQGIRHAYIKRGTPQLNGKVERSHRSDQQEFYQLLSYKGDVDLEAKLSEWENFYNFNRPHGAFNGKTPYEALRERL